jgi:hypothetical protein
MKKLIALVIVLITGVTVNVHAVAAAAKITPVEDTRTEKFELKDIAPKIKPHYPKVEDVTEPMYLANGMIGISMKQLSNGDLHYKFQTPTTKDQIRKYAGSLENYLEVVKGFALGALESGDVPADASTALVLTHGKAWHYTYYDVNGDLIGTVIISMNVQPTVEL